MSAPSLGTLRFAPRFPAVVLGLAALVAQGACVRDTPSGHPAAKGTPAAATMPAHSEMADDMTAGHPDAAPLAPPADPAALARFSADLTSQGSTREVFARHLPALGGRAILNELERRNPSCHGEAHDLGRALMALRKDIGVALRECGTGCTSACMHGAVGEAFGGSDVATITSKMNDFCNSSPMRELHPAGNCAHGIGHALMFASDRDVDAALKGCGGFAKAGMQHYCATGVYLQQLQGPKHPAYAAGSHEPCSTHPRYAAACYRYRALGLASEAGGLDALRAACLAQKEPMRRACFHGLGSVLVRPAMADPTLISRYCASDSAEDRTLCVEGAMEKQADFSADAARAVCARQQGDIRTACDAAVTNGMYNVEKASIGLYVTGGGR